MIRNSSRERLLVLVTGLLLGLTASAHAAPDRLNDDVPDAVLDQPGAFSFTYSHEALKLEGPLSDEGISHDYFKLRYTLNPKTALTFRYGTHNLNGGLGLVNPLFDNRDGAESYNFDLALNLLNVNAVPADPANNKEFEAGSAFNVGVSGTLFQTDMGDLASEDSLLRAYLVYTTDLSPEMRAHTIFTTSRLSGDSASGSVNRIGAGLDYTLIDGARPLTLMANAILDVYNFRQPDFNTSRISRFDVGLRYRVARSWYTSLGYTTYNDSENDASGSGIFASVQYVDEPGTCVTCEPLPLEEQPPAEAEAALNNTVAPSAAVDNAPAQVVAAEPTLMKNTAQQEPQTETSDAGLRKAEQQLAEAEAQAPAPTEDQAPADADDQAPAATEEQAAAESADQQSDETVTEEPAEASDAEEAPPDDNETPATDNNAEAGVVIPELPLEHPRLTPASAVMVRAGGSAPDATPRYTSADDVLLRTPVDPSNTDSLGELFAQQTAEEEAPPATAMIALRTGVAVQAEADITDGIQAEASSDADNASAEKTASEAGSSEEN